ncbi:hypothetical protein [Kitasatospora camelliae]|uniref:Uncharacterized protein n=1 Tax=Kitasatospora camelliae TaxID=3156397 RepID=A0AAU8JQC5_9ACTN
MTSPAVIADDRVLLPPRGAAVDGGLAGPTALPVAAIRDADPSAAPPEIRTRAGETVFLAAAQAGRLEEFCRDHGIPLRRRPDVWADLLEVFLDTGFPPEHHAATAARLARLGLDAAATARIRAEVAPLMHRYYAVHWEWHHLGLADLLDAHATYGGPAGGVVDLADPADPAVAAQADFRPRAMRIADLGHGSEV